MLHAGSFRVSFDVAPSARPFDIAAVGEGGGSIISIDPAAGTYTAIRHHRHAGSRETRLVPVRAAGFFLSRLRRIECGLQPTQRALAAQ